MKIYDITFLGIYLYLNCCALSSFDKLRMEIVRVRAPVFVWINGVRSSAKARNKNPDALVGVQFGVILYQPRGGKQTKFR